MTVFLTFWQAVLLSGLSMFGVVKDVSLSKCCYYACCLVFNFQSQYMTADDINTGLSAILETFEMMYVFPLYISIRSHIRSQALCIPPHSRF